MTSDQRKKGSKSSNNNFLEALRDLGGDLAASTVNELGQGVVKDTLSQITGWQSSGDLKPDQPLELQKKSFPQKEKLDRQARSFYQEYLDIRQQEKIVFSKVEQETKLQIAVILDELKKLALSTKSLAKEVEVAALQVPVDPGTYHLNFFEKLRETLILLRKRIDDSASWLSGFNQRAKRRSYYWGQFKKSGSKFLLSQERYMSTQAG